MVFEVGALSYQDIRAMHDDEWEECVAARELYVQELNRQYKAKGV